MIHRWHPNNVFVYSQFIQHCKLHQRCRLQSKLIAHQNTKVTAFSIWRWRTEISRFQKIYFEKSSRQYASLTAIEKMSYLKGSTTGEAGLLLRNITLSRAKYEIAWKAVSQYYKDQLFIVESHFDVLSLLSLKRNQAKTFKIWLITVDMSLKSLEFKRGNAQWLARYYCLFHLHQIT